MLTLKSFRGSLFVQFIAASIMIVISVAAVAQPNGSNRNGGAKDNSSSGATDPKQPESFWQNAETDPVAAFTGTLALFTFALVVISGFQIYFLNRSDKTARLTAEAAIEAGRLAKKQFEVAQESHEFQFRPYLSINGISCDDNGFVTISVINNGKTPANGVGVKFFYSFRAGKDTAIENDGTATPSSVQIAPGIVSQFRFGAVELGMLYMVDEVRVSATIRYNDWLTINKREARLTFVILESREISEIAYNSN